jgi:FkbM family methyltransferase
MRLGMEKRKLLKDEFDDMAFLWKTLGRQPKDIFDCGANIGFVTHAFAQRFPDTTIHAFEPNPKVFEPLASAHGNKRNVILHNKGVGRTKGELTFHINRNSGTSSFLPPNDYHTLNFADKNTVPKVVEVVGLGEYMEEKKIPVLDILKLDIEGFELEALKGIRDIGNRVAMVYTEVNLVPTYQGQPLINDIISYLHGFGFHIFNFYGIYENDYRQASFTNLLFISTGLKNELKNIAGEKNFGY